MSLILCAWFFVCMEEQGSKIARACKISHLRLTNHADLQEDSVLLYSSPLLCFTLLCPFLPLLAR